MYTKACMLHIKVTYFLNDVLASFLKIFVRHSITDVAADAASVRPASEIPGPKNLPLIGTMYKFLPGGDLSCEIMYL